MTASPVTVPPRFAALDDQRADYESARVVVVPLPYDATTTFRTGCREGPRAILDASAELELFDAELLATPADVGIATLDPPEVDARGPEYMVDVVRDTCLRPVRDGKFVIALGGEHTVSVGCLRAQVEHRGSDLTVLQLDAHADLRDSYQRSPYSHACAARRMMEECPVVGVGIRTFTREEHAFMQAQGIESFTMERIRRTPDWIQRLIERLGPRVYLTLDLDGLDPSVCPGVGTPEPGGLTWEDLTTMLRAVASEREIVGADVVECLPLAGQHTSQYLAAKLVYKVIGYRFCLEKSQGSP